MRFIHRVGLRANSAHRRELELLGVEVPPGVALPGDGDALVAFDVAEDHPSWPNLLVLLRQWNASDLLRTEFAASEIASATWLKVDAAWHSGYPQPNELEFGYREATYDLTDYCERCGIGMKQNAPFQMKGEPRWGRNSILQLNWVFDEYFTTPELWASVFKLHDIQCRPVWSTKRTELKTVVQLVTNEEVGVVTEGLLANQEVCSKCERVKYLPATRGFFPGLATEPSAAMVKTTEYFGSGASAHKGVLISQAVARALRANKVLGLSLRPVAERNDGSTSSRTKA